MKETILKQLVLNRTLDTCNDFVLWADISDLEVLADKIEKAITVTRCCESDSEQLLAIAKYVYCNYDESSSKKPEDYLKDFKSQ